MAKILKIGLMYRKQLLAGDAIAMVAQPIAKAIDRLSPFIGKPTHIATCAACKKRRERANKKLGNLNPFSR